MGMFDTVIVPCPECGEEHQFQSKSGECFLQVVDLDECPVDILADVNRHSPYTCDCGTVFEVDLSTRKSTKTDDLLTFDNISELGFEYNYFEGYTHQTKDGFSISVYDVTEIRYRGETYKCLTKQDFIKLRKKVGKIYN